MSKFDWKRTLATVAPVLASALGGPMVGVAVKIAADALGMPAGATEQDIAEAVASGSPDVLLKLREADNAFQLEMERLGVAREQIHADDRASARDLGKARGLGPQISLAVIFVCGFVYVLGVIFQGHTIEPEMREIATYVLGILSAGLVQIMNYFFGSSAGSRQKTDQMAGMLK
ncbi:hypothetical protein KC887_08945 [Candidatus Kaiserbacteria bacterium]|nr:hypothetical protein [Candidatus Kaiserbacteria bacterium]